MLKGRLLLVLSAGFGAAVVLSRAHARDSPVASGDGEVFGNSSSKQKTELQNLEMFGPPIATVDFSLLYPTLAPTETVLLPNQLAARDEQLKAQTQGPQSVFLKSPPQVTLSNVYEVHVVSDCMGGHCSYGSLNIYLQRTNWFVKPEEAPLSSLSSALKEYALHLAIKTKLTTTLHRSFVIRSPKIWFSNARSRVKAEIGSVCFMQPRARQFRDGSWKVEMLRTHKDAKIKSLLDSTRRGMVLTAPAFNSPDEIQDFVLLNALFETKEEAARARQQTRQNLFGLCRMPRSNLFRRLAEKKFVLCTVVVRNEKHVVDVCKDLPVHEIHTMQAVYEVHRRLNNSSLPMLGYVPTTLPPDSQVMVAAFVEALQPAPLEASDAAFKDECTEHVSQQLRELEMLHVSELWHAAETSKPIRPSVLTRSLIKFAHFHKGELAPESAPERRPSLLKLVNKWARTCELIRHFNAAVASCPNPTIRPIYFPQYQSKVVLPPEEHTHDLLGQLQRILNVEVPPVHRLLLGGAYVLSWTLNPRNMSENNGRNELAELADGTRELLVAFAKRHLLDGKAVQTVAKYANQIIGKAKLVLESALPLELQSGLIRSLLPVPFFLFAVGSHCGPSEKHNAFELGYGLCPYHFLAFFVREARTAAEKHPHLEDWAKRLISKWVKSLHVGKLPETAKAEADVFLEQHAKDLPLKLPDFFLTRRGKTYKVFPAPAAAF